MTPALFAACEKAVHVITKDGQTLRAGRACLFVLAELGWRGVARVLLLAPILWFVEIGYGIVAAHRDFFAGFMFTRDHSTQAPEPPPVQPVQPTQSGLPVHSEARS